MKRLLLTASLLLIAALAMAAEPTSKPAPATVAPGKGIRTVYFVRHGFYEADSTADPATGPGLNALGREQAAIVGRYLAGLPVKFNTMTSSLLTRARQTADLMAPALHMRVERDSLLSECTPRSVNAAMNSNHDDAEIVACDAQLEAAWEKYLRPSPDADTHDVIVAHGNVIRWFVARTVAGDAKRWGTMDIAHCSVTVITVRPDGTARLVMFSDLGDLPVEKQTWAGRGAGWVKPSGGMK